MDAVKGAGEYEVVVRGEGGETWGEGLLTVWGGTSTGEGEVSLQRGQREGGEGRS